MARERTQLNINIDPALLMKLKAEAIRQGKTLTDFVVQQLEETPSSPNESNLEQRLLRVEKFLKLDNGDSTENNEGIGTIFTDVGAKEYGNVAKAEFEAFAKKKQLKFQDALKELANHLKNYPHSNPELVFQILLGTHELTGLEMTMAYRSGSCAMRSALNDWTKRPLEKLNIAFLNAVKTKNLV